MAKLFVHPEVEDYFHTLKWDQNAASLANSATELYEAGQVAVIDGLKIECDLEFLSSLHFSEAQTKKFKSISFLKQMSSPKLFGLFGTNSSPNSPDFLYETFGGDKRKLKYFSEQVRNVNEQISAIIEKLVPDYRIEKPSVTWRLNETVNENLHVDVYNDDIPGHHFRVFTNLDIVPRIWHTSHSLEYLLRHKLNQLDPEFIRTATPGRICHALNFKVFGGFEQAGREGQPKHIAFFEPGDVWIVDSRKVSHQIFYGRKALSTEHVIAHDSMRDPATHYYELVDRYRHELGRTHSNHI